MVSRRNKRLGIAGAVAGAGVGAAVGLRHLAVGRVRMRPDPDASEPFGELSGRPVPVAADDGIPLYVEVDGPDDAALTVVFTHGYCLDLHTWHYQRRDLRDRDGYRMVFWDQRSHGRSGRSEPERSTIEQTAADLEAVLTATVPKGSPVILVGHSMGSMTIMALAERRPELFAPPGRGKKPEFAVLGTVLVNTSAGDLGELTLGLPLVLARLIRPIAPTTLRGLSRRKDLVDRARIVGADLAFIVTRRMGFADPYVSPTVVDFTEQMIRRTPIDVIAEFYPTLVEHDRGEALPVLAKVPSVVVVAGEDRFTPVEHGHGVAEALGAEAVEIEEAGHVLPLEYPGVVTGAVRRLVDQTYPELRERTA